MALNDSDWELIDPNPNILTLFQKYNDVFFNSKLGAVVVEWSKRMTSCAGICQYQTKSGFCVIRLSEPLLKFRSRNDMIETLLHEMIHAYLFVTVSKMDRDGHGPDFIEHMTRINKITGLKISVYHTFIDEVRYHQKHEWRCNGVCRLRSPYFGILRRATNRAPGPNDTWWAHHQATCGGTYIKVADDTTKPEKENRDKKKAVATNGDIRKYLENNKPVAMDFETSGSSISTGYPQVAPLGSKWWSDSSTSFDPTPTNNVNSSLKKPVPRPLKISAVSTDAAKLQTAGKPKDFVFDFTKYTLYKASTNTADGPAEIQVTSDLFFDPPTCIKMTLKNNNTIDYNIKPRDQRITHSNDANRARKGQDAKGIVNLCDDSD